MSDEADKESKTEEPSQKRIDDFRKQGRIAFSRDLVGAATLFVALLAFGSFGRLVASVVAIDLRERLNHLDAPLTWPVRPLAIGAALALACMVVAALVSFVQMGAPAEIDFFKGLKQYNPLARLKKLFSMQGLENLGMQLLKLSVMIGILYLMLRQDWVALATSHQVPLMDNMAFAARFAWKLGLAATLALGGLGAVDYIRMRREIMAEMRMTKEEIKREHKEENGDGSVKRRMRSLIKSLMKNDVPKAVASADVVIVNPTHYAVAIKYDRKRMRAPRVVAKGVDHMALRIRAIASEKRVPVVENVALARGLHAQVKVGKDIPVELYKAVAEVLAAIYRTRRSRA